MIFQFSYIQHRIVKRVKFHVTYRSFTPKFAIELTAPTIYKSVYTSLSVVSVTSQRINLQWLFKYVESSGTAMSFKEKRISKDRERMSLKGSFSTYSVLCYSIFFNSLTLGFRGSTGKNLIPTRSPALLMTWKGFFKRIPGVQKCEEIHELQLE